MPPIFHLFNGKEGEKLPQQARKRMPQLCLKQPHKMICLHVFEERALHLCVTAKPCRENSICVELQFHARGIRIPSWWN